MMLHSGHFPILFVCRDEYDMARLVTAVEGSKSTMTIVGAVKEDSGEFTCTINNNIGQPASKQAKLVVKCK